MSIISKILIVLLIFFVSPIQKEKDKCLIIKLKDNKELYTIGTIGNSKNQFYISLKFKNPKKNKEYDNPLITIPVKKYSEGTSYNLFNKEELKSLPDTITDCDCDCANLEKLNLGMNFKLYVEKEKGWETYDAKKLLVEE